MHPKDLVFMALCLALCAMGFLVTNLLRGLWGDAAFAGFVMVGAAAYVTRYVARTPLPQALYRRGRES